MGKAEKTRIKIIEEAAALFNIRGYSGTAISDVMASTGLKKGGIYTHFESKEQLAIAAFDYAFEQTIKQYREIYEQGETPVDKLIDMIEINRRMDTDSPVEGGCPLLNVAIESDDHHPKLKRRAQSMMRLWQRHIKRILRDGIETGDFRADIDQEYVATRIISTIEGSIMMSKLMDEHAYLDHMLDYLVNYVQEELAA